VASRRSAAASWAFVYLLVPVVHIPLKMNFNIQHRENLETDFQHTLVYDCRHKTLARSGAPWARTERCYESASKRSLHFSLYFHFPPG
jgi:hypothetical protein